MKKHVINLAKLAAAANTLESQLNEWEKAENMRQRAHKAATFLEDLLLAEFREPNRAEGSLLQVDGNTMSFQQRIPGNWDHLRIVRDELGNALVMSMLRERLWKVNIVVRKIKCTRIAAAIPAAYTVEISMVTSPNAEICEEQEVGIETALADSGVKISFASYTDPMGKVHTNQTDWIDENGRHCHRFPNGTVSDGKQKE